MKHYCYCVVALWIFFLLCHAPAAALSVCAENPLGNTLNIGEQIRVPILIDQPNGVGAFGFLLKYDVLKVSYVEVQKSVATQGFIVVSGNENFPGEITIGGFGTPPISTTDPDTLCFVLFDEIIDEPNAELSCIFMTAMNFTDDIGTAPQCITNKCQVPIETGTWGRIKALWGDL